jgi:hypothetical protein
MNETLDVLVVPSHPGVADPSVAVLEKAGHRVHRCQDEGRPAFPCKGVTDPSACPLDGKIDLALAVRRGNNPWPTALESGLSCAIRAGVPIVEDGAAEGDPFDPWVLRRVDGQDVATACSDALSTSREPLLADIAHRITGLLAAEAIDPSQITFEIDRSGPSLDLHVTIPVPATRRLEQSIAVRVLDAIRASGRTYGNVDVHVHAAATT